MWADTYNFAQLAESIGVGVYGSRGTAPGLSVQGLSDAFRRVLDDGEAESARMREKAREIGAIAQANPGNDIAAGEVARLAYMGRWTD